MRGVSEGADAWVSDVLVAFRFFLLLLVAGAFLRECVRFWDLRVWRRRERVSLSGWEVGRMGIMLVGV